MEVLVPGTPFGKQRPRAGRRGKRTVVYTPRETVDAEERVRVAWLEAGHPRIEEGPVELELEAVMHRPRDHFRADGTLTPKGQREPWPLKKPDIDNVLKLVTDALNKVAYRDDAQVVSIRRAVRRWSRAGEDEHTRVDLRPFGGEPVGFRPILL